MPSSAMDCQRASLRQCLRGSVRWLNVLALALVTPAMAAGQPCAESAWPLWQAYASRFVQADGRVLESSLEKNHSTSEGQSYGMLFALIGNDPQRFDKLWRWTTANLAESSIGTRLPGWLWGQGEDGQWRLQDNHSASDADLWFAYALLEAARLWHRPDYRQDALRLMAIIETQLVVDLPGLGPMLLPGPEGFIQPNHLWRLNPSYLPLPLLRRLAKQAPSGPWQAIARNTATMISQSSHHGFVADWVGYQGTSTQSGGFVSDPIKGETGSYDAIRVYLWLGMSDARERLATPLLKQLDGMARLSAANGFPPESVQVLHGRVQGQGPFGFHAALIPYFHAKGQSSVALMLRHNTEQALREALARPDASAGPPRYYNLMLSLFALGWADKNYRFREDGTLKLSWETPCTRTTAR
ncbi:cellulose synthase complex periplasmic endoglucanase BcsZ [Pseudomonas sp. 10S4]|uniref:cellulose synthase complex periplasmic endoglucanase BcsZ n=1 Tax=Pseudomonas sp. 10S4 TaxID=3048583 RepID=UPI002B23152B|nr:MULTISPECIES: cellulose synthase complex periplasmic endoglucanase BcsZ [unclassified Pseudomonas]MEB0225183.1 cellulose synthase complex periplasmic endoglucanase BcsZ [Pseudomonas sp. 5S1]MEB0293979.1 cellulose synthase complex periplasmic endoglucanase BcsZ [Pseudomonas sp. 10S4]